MKQRIAFVMTLLMATTLISVSAETYPMDAKGLQEWDIQENEVIQMMREIFIGQHENRVCSENGESWHPVNDGYDPDDYYSYLCAFHAYVNEYGAYREWYCYAFYLDMPYGGWHIKVDSPSGKVYSLGPPFYTSPTYQKDDDIRAAREAIEDHMDLLSAIHPSLSETAEYSFRLNLDRESRATWNMSYRVIPLTLLLHTDNEDVDFDDLFVVIQLKRNENDYNREYYWHISVYSEEAIKGYDESLIIPSQMIPIFSDNAIFQVYIPRF